MTAEPRVRDPQPDDEAGRVPGREPGRESERRGRQAPAVPDGASTGPPDFIGVGVHKAGTTWWWALLAAHPDIDAVVRRKELHLLDRMREGPITAEQKEWYYRQFPRLPGHLAGEWTPRYMAMPPIAGIIREVAPEARLLTILREPVERYRSGLKQWQEQARRRSLRRDDRAGKREALMRGFYGRQVQRLVDALPRERLLVLQYEQCVRSPAEELARTLRFLGVSPWEPDQRMLTMRYNQTMGAKGTLSPREEAELVTQYEPEVALLKELVPELDLSLWPRFAHLERA
jgi:hypothetical protein